MKLNELNNNDTLNHALNKLPGDEERENDEYDEYDDDDDEGKSFLVAFYDEKDNTYWVGQVEHNGSKWVEQEYDGKPDYKWGNEKYMGYLKPKDVTDWIQKDYDRDYIVSGPLDGEEAVQNFIYDQGGDSVKLNNR